MGEELRKRRWSDADLKQRRKAEAKKVQMAMRLRRETVQTLDWIAARLHMGLSPHAGQLLEAGEKLPIAGTDP